MFDIIGIAIILCAVFVAVSKDLLLSSIALSMLSLLTSIYFYIMNAPDVALAEAGIGACLITAIYILSIKVTGRFEDEN